MISILLHLSSPNASLPLRRHPECPLASLPLKPSSTETSQGRPYSNLTHSHATAASWKVLILVTSVTVGRPHDSQYHPPQHQRLEACRQLQHLNKLMTRAEPRTMPDIQASTLSDTEQNLARTMPDVQASTLSDRHYTHRENFEEIGGDA